MHFLICLIFGLFLLSEGTSGLTVSPGRVLLAISMVTASPIVLAWLQGLELVRCRRLAGPQPELEGRALRQADAIHMAAWACASLAGIWLMQWPTLVRSTWALRGWLLIDELLVITPPLISLLASWMVFEWALRPLQPELRSGDEVTGHPRSHVWSMLLRFFPATVYKFQHSLGLALLPLLLLFAIRDLCGAEQASVQSVFWAGGAGLLAVVLFYPLYLKWLLPSERLELALANPDLQGLELRQWHSNFRVYNALVTGLIPGWQTVFVSDGLVKHFPPVEIAAIVRHEVAHARRGHLLLRSLAIAGPLLVLLTVSVCGVPVWGYLMSIGARFNPVELMLLGIGVGSWAWGVIRPLSHWIEYDADRQATLNPGTGLGCPQRTDALKSALLRLAHGFPEQFRRSTLFHPSLESRLKRLSAQ
jgi:STE24 endopeptidase